MKTITEHDGKNVNMQVVGDLHQYPDGSVHTVKEGKAVWEEGGGDSGGSDGGVLMVTDTEGTLDKTMGEIQDAYLSGKRIVIHRSFFYADALCVVTIGEEKGEYVGAVCAYFNRYFAVYVTAGETEDAVRNAYPTIEE